MKRRLLNAEVPPPASDDLLNAKVTPPATTDLLAAACLKKKEINKADKNSKRRKDWTERQYKRKKIGPATTTTPPLSKVPLTHCTIQMYFTRVLIFKLSLATDNKAEKNRVQDKRKSFNGANSK